MRERSNLRAALVARMVAWAKALAGIGAAVLLASGACFLALGDVGPEEGVSMPWIIGVALVVGGVVAVVAILGAAEG